ncbi:MULTISPECIES: type IV secretory system conjugative DNA transfer family protein [Bacillus]|uniref:type IV secretory system conjugative DNA transfer family protein n=1 Tax=Bacillus TaxID=1386 RepID=UPI000A5998DD|nr:MULTISPECIES: type IV secretory system conjugative DNA transfer family protein [Bacillus]
MESNLKLKGFVVNLFLFGSLLLSIYLTTLIHKDFIKEITSGNTKHIWTFGIITAVLLFIIIALSVAFSKNRKVQLADGELLQPQHLKAEQREQYMKGTFHTRNQRTFKKDKSGILISRNVKLSTKKSYEHVLLLGPTGSGKSAQFFKPNLRNIDDTSLVVTDPKGELHLESKDFLEAKGYRVIHLNFNDPTKSSFYNLVENCHTDDDLMSLSDSLLEQAGGEWGPLSKSLFLCLLYLARDQGRTNLTEVLKILGEAPRDMDELETFFSESPEALTEFYQFQKTMGAGAFVGSVYATIIRVLGVFKYKQMEYLGSRSDFSPGDLRLEKTALFVSYPESKSEAFQPFLSSFYYQLLSQIKDHESMYEGNTGKKGLGVVFFCDEFANIGVIPALDIFLTTIRSKKMCMVLGIQSFQQVKQKYGEKASIILENCKCKLVLPGSSGESAKAFSELVGEHEYDSYSFSTSDKSNLSLSQSKQKKSILSYDQIRRLKGNETVCIFGNLRPFRDLTNYYYMDDLAFKYAHETKLPEPLANFMFNNLRKIIPDGVKKEEKRVAAISKKLREQKETETEKVQTLASKRISPIPEERKEAQIAYENQIKELKEPTQPLQELKTETESKEDVLHSLRNFMNE